MNVALCDRCAPLLGRPELDTPAKLAVQLCLPCKGRLAVGTLASKGPSGAALARFVDGAIAVGVAGVSIAAAAQTAAELVESTADQVAQATGLARPRPRRRRRRK